MAQRNPAWFTDPSDPRLARWHDGDDWTDFTMVVAEWTSPEPPPPPAGWSPRTSPTEGLVPAFGAAAPPRPAAAPDPAPTPRAEPEPAPAPAPAPGPAAEPEPGPAPAAEPEGAAQPEPAHEPSPPAASPDDGPRGLARLAELAGDRPPASGVRIAAPVAEPDPPPAPSPQPAAPQPPPAAAPPAAPEPSPDHEPAPTPAFRRDPTPSGSMPATLPTSEPEEEEEEDDDDHELRHVGHGPEAPGPDWGGGVEAPRPQRRPSGWNDDPDELPAAPLVQRSVLDRYRGAPLWVRLGLPLALIALATLVALQMTGGDDDSGTASPFGDGDGTLEEATANEPGMDDAVEAAREAGVPEAISDQELATLVKGVCSAARRSLVPLNLSQNLAGSGVDATTLQTAATSIGTGALEFCPDQDNTIPQVVSVLVARTERMLETPSG